MPLTKTIKMLVAEAKAETTAIAPTVAKAKADAGKATLIDIRDIRELDREGRIDGAFHAPRGMLNFGPIQRARITRRFLPLTVI